MEETNHTTTHRTPLPVYHVHSVTSGVHKCVFVSTVVHNGVYVCDSDVHCMAHVHCCHMMAFMT